MNKFITICTCIVLCCAMLVACAAGNAGNSHGAFIGMTYDEFCEQIPEDQYSLYFGYLFFTDSLGNPYAACLDEACTTIVECYSYSQNQFDTSAESFSKIVPGMTILEVVELVGFPVDSPLFGFASLLFIGDEGEYIVILDLTCDKVSEISLI